MCSYDITDPGNNREKSDMLDKMYLAELELS